MEIPARVKKAVERLLSGRGESRPELRRAVLEGSRGRGEVPADLRAYVDKIAARPWTVTDEDFAQLRAAGYSEDQIYELTLSAAVGASLARFDAGLRALDEDR